MNTNIILSLIRRIEIRRIESGVTVSEGKIESALKQLEQLEKLASKQVPIEVGKKWNGNDYDAFCPKCGDGVWEMNYCQNCGQKLMWGESE